MQYVSHPVCHIPGIRVPEDVGGAADPTVVGEQPLVRATVGVTINVVSRELQNRKGFKLTQQY